MLSSLTETFMAPAGSKDAAPAARTTGNFSAKRPSTFRPNRASSRAAEAIRASMNPSAAPTAPATTAAAPAVEPVPSDDSPAPSDAQKDVPSGPDTIAAQDTDGSAPELPRASVDLDELPIELIGLADSFVESLQAKIHPTPPDIDNLSHKFQEFYATASSHIVTHIAALATRQSRERSTPPPATSLASRTSRASRASAAAILRSKPASSNGTKDKPSTSTPEQKRALLEEAIERRLCEGIYNRIYRHRTTQDEAQDEKLRSKTAALDVVGISPADLGVDLGVPSDATPDAVAERLREVRQWLEPARKELVQMGQTHYPLGKLNRLKAAHKGIVDTLAHFHPSSSADEIMPMLIYTLITLPPEQLNVVSDLNFIQRFRWESKMEGESSYCLTNLEAAISFLATVDLSTLRADEAPSGPVRLPTAESPKTETFPPAYCAQQSLTPATPSAPEVSASQAAASGIKPTPSPSAGLIAAVQLRNRRLSDLVNTPAHALSTASDAVMNTFSAADQGLKTIGNSLEGSYRLLFGRLGQTQHKPTTPDVVVLPKTLDDARKLIATPTPPPLASEDEAFVNGEDPAGPDHDQTPQTTPPPAPIQRQSYRRLVSNGNSSNSSGGATAASAAGAGRGREDKMLLMLGGRKTSREPSADSSRSIASSRKTAAADDEPSTSTGSTANNPALLDSVRNLGNSFNPMSRLSSIGTFRGFGRTTPAVPSAAEKTDGSDLATAFPDLAASLPPKPQVTPPIKRFMELHTPADLRIGEVAELLQDYRRLAAALKDLGAFKER